MLCGTLMISNMALRILVIPVVARCLAAVRVRRLVPAVPAGDDDNNKAVLQHKWVKFVIK